MIPDIGRMWLNGSTVAADLRDAVVKGTWESKITGATVIRLTLHDPDRKIRDSGALNERLILEVGEDRLRYELADYSKRGSMVSLVFDDWIAAQADSFSGWMPAAADVTTRAGFVKMLAAEAGVPCEVDPAAAVVNVPLSRGTDRVAGSAAGGPVQAGASYPVVTRDGWAAAPDLAVAATIAQVALQVGASTRATLAAFEAAIVESRVQNIGFGDRDSLGVMQQRDAWGPAEVRLNPAEAIRMFFLGGQGGQRGALHYDSRGVSHNGTVITTAGELAQATQVSAHPGRYDAVEAVALALQTSVAGQVGTVLATGTPKPETSWECGARLAREVGLRSFSDGQRWLFGSDDWLRGRAAPVRIREHTDGYGDVDFDIRSRGDVDIVRVDARAARWAVAAGHPAHILDAGPATGEDYLVVEVRGDLFTSAVDAVCARAHAPLPEPVAPTTAPTTGGVGGAAPGVVSRTGFQWPTVAGRVISVWGDSRDGGARSHKGIDIADDRGAPIYAAKDGTVRVAHDVDNDTYGGYGRVIYVDHPDGWQTRYAHNTTNLVAVGAQVSRGQQIATVGDTGNARGTPPHNHFETRFDGSAVDPLTVLPAR